MKKYIICIVILSICLVAALALAVYVENDRTDTIHNQGREMLNYLECNNHQADMSNYVIEHYDDIFALCNEVLQNYDSIIYKDEFGRGTMEINLYKDMLDKYNLSYFYDYDYTKTYRNIWFDEDEILFWYDHIDFYTDSDNIKDDYCVFSFYVKDGNITISPYDYAPYQTGY